MAMLYFKVIMKWSVKSLSEIILHINVYLCVKIFVNCKPDFIVDYSKTYPLELKNTENINASLFVFTSILF